jgi:hypothetical protein
MEHTRIHAFDVLIRTSGATSWRLVQITKFALADVLRLRADVLVPSMADRSF